MIAVGRPSALGGLAVLLSLLPGSVAEAEPPPGLAVVPVSGINIDDADRVRLARALRRGLARTERFELIAPDCVASVTRQSEGTGDRCTSQRACLRRVARTCGAHRIVALNAGRLGDTVVLRLSAFDGEGARYGTWQKVLRRLDQRAVRGALDEMIAGFAPPPPRRWYSRWWVWTAAATVVAGTVTAIAIATSGGDGGTPLDGVINPP